MSFCLIPDVILKRLTELTPELLSARGISFLMMDFDNTIVPYTTDVPTEPMRAWLEQMKSSNIRLCVVSNSKRPRVVTFCRTYGLDCITHARKPFQKGISECLTRFHLRPSQAALVGDQIYTDVLGANCAGLTSILVSAIDNHTVVAFGNKICNRPVDKFKAVFYEKLLLSGQCDAASIHYISPSFVRSEILCRAI